jgi:hypothetical protein
LLIIGCQESQLKKLKSVGFGINFFSFKNYWEHKFLF